MQWQGEPVLHLSEAAAEAVSVLGLLLVLAVATVRPRGLPEAVVAAPVALLLLAAGAIGLTAALDAAAELAPTLGFLAVVLILARLCQAEGVFTYAGRVMARGAHGSPRRLLLLVYVVASLTTAVLSLDATVVLLTPVVLAAAARVGADAEPHVYATAHLANAASLLLPVSNLTNLLAFRASGLGFGRFAALMAGPWIVAITLDYTVVRLRFAPRLAVSRPRAGLDDDGPAPVLALGVLGAVLLGFALASPLGIDVVWPALAGVLVLLGVRLVRGAPAGRELASALRAANPLFLAFVLALGVVVRAVVDHGLADAARRLLPAGTGLLSVIATAVIAAVLANLVNNLPATLMLIPLVAPAGAVPVLAVLIGVNVGPNLTYVGSLATLLWRRVLAGHGRHSDLAEFTRLGALAVPASVVAAAVALWASAAVVGA